MSLYSPSLQSSKSALWAAYDKIKSTSDVRLEIFFNKSTKSFLASGNDIYIKYGWTTPSLDVFFYDENATHVQKLQGHKSKPGEGVRKDVVFPLVKRPFNGRMFPAPRDPRKFLNALMQKHANYIDAFCVVGPHDYYTESRKPHPYGQGNTVRCSKLLKYFPFVRHTKGAGGDICIEEKMFKGKVVSTFVRDGAFITQC